MVDTVIVENEARPAHTVSWPAILAGAAVMSALSLLLAVLGSGIGFSVINPYATNAGITTTKVATVAGIYLTCTAIIAGGLGGFVAGRLRGLWGAPADETYFRDTAHGLVAWAVATVAGAAFLASAGTAITGGAVTGASQGAAQAAVPAYERGAFAGIADKLYAYDYTAVSRQQAGQPVTGIARDYAGDRMATSRLFDRLWTTRDGAFTADDRVYLASMVAARTGVSLPEAEKRVAAAEAETRAAAETARRVGMMIAFWTVAAMFAGALAASLGALEGGAQRDGRNLIKR
jgi:hypothetical protein